MKKARSSKAVNFTELSKTHFFLVSIVKHSKHKNIEPHQSFTDSSKITIAMMVN